MKKIKIVDSHHKVLIHWAELRKDLNQAPVLLTLDHHTDTSKPFQKKISQICRDKDIVLNETDFLNLQKTYLDQIDFKNLDSIKTAIEHLNNDEHIVAAIQSDIISSAFVIAHNARNTDAEVYKNHKIVCQSVPEAMDKNGKLNSNNDIVLESEFLNSAIDNFNKLLISVGQSNLFSSPFILDIDLDYFNSFKSIAPIDLTVFNFLVENASLITIATEPEYVKSCAIDKGLTSEYLLEKMLSILEY